RGDADGALRAGRDCRALSHAVSVALAPRSPREALSAAVVVERAPDEAAAIPGSRAGRRRSRSRRQALEKGAPAGQARPRRDLALVEAAARAPLVLHADARLGICGEIGAAQPNLSGWAALDGRHRRASGNRRALYAADSEARRRAGMIKTASR